MEALHSPAGGETSVLSAKRDVLQSNNQSTSQTELSSPGESAAAATVAAAMTAAAASVVRPGPSTTTPGGEGHIKQRSGRGRSPSPGAMSTKRTPAKSPSVEKSKSHNGPGSGLKAQLSGRKIRPSRLDHCDPDSDISRSQFRGLAHMILTSGGLWMAVTPIYSKYEYGYFFEPTLAKSAFSDTELLMLVWFQCIIAAHLPYLYHVGRRRGLLSRWGCTWLTFASIFGLIVNTSLWILFRQWSVFPKVFVITVTLIHSMKMHSFTATTLDLEEDTFNDFLLHRVRELTQSGRREVAGAMDPAATPVVLMYGGTDSIEAVITNEGGKTSLAAGVTGGASAASALPPPPPRHRFLPQISLRSFVKYIFAPTLVFEIDYPKMTHPFRPWYFVHKAWDLASVLAGIYLLSSHFIIPALEDAPNQPIIVTLARTVVPLIVMDFLFFYLMFECVLNMLGEITSFGDREFYEDWWNSTNWDEFSRKWNRPVHEYLLKHIYMKFYNPANRRSKLVASVVTFAFSACIHEAFMSAILGFVRFWLFTIMLCQIPLIILGKVHKGTVFGNFYFWFGICLGVPVLCTLYGTEWARRISE